MSKIIQIISHNNELVLLTDTGELWSTSKLTWIKISYLPVGVYCSDPFPLPPELTPQEPTNYIPPIKLNKNEITTEEIALYNECKKKENQNEKNSN